MRSYNEPHHRSIGMAPSQVSAANQEEVWQRMNGHDGKGVPKFRVEDRVSISKAKRQLKRVHGELERGDLYDTRGSTSNPRVYRLVDDLGEMFDGAF